MADATKADGLSKDERRASKQARSSERKAQNAAAKNERLAQKAAARAAKPSKAETPAE